MFELGTIYSGLFIVLLALYGIEAQDRCITPLNKSGSCINIRNCQPLVDVLRRPRPLSQESLDFLRNSQCGFEGTYPKVCCESQTTQVIQTPPTTSLPETAASDPPDVTNHPNLNLLSHDVCGPITQSKIVGGNKTGVFDFPWMALIAYNTGRPVPEFRCGGTLINKRYILTAAHCLTLLPNDLVVIGARVGDHDISKERDCNKDEKGLEVLCAERYQDFGIEAVIAHSGFTLTKLQNDIGLMRLDGDVDLRPSSVRPICLPIGASAIMTQTKVTVTGWGATELGPRSQDLLKIQLGVVNNADCLEAYKGRIPISYKQMCAGGKKSMDSCLGDSGGPLQSPTIYFNNKVRFVQYGIVSFGLQSCGTEGVPGVYTRVPFYMDWILNNIRA